MTPELRLEMSGRLRAEDDSMLEWAGGSYDPDTFDPAAVIFEDPHERWKKA